MLIKDASNSGKATGNNQPVRQKAGRVVQHKHQCNNSNGDDDNGNGDSGNNDDNDNYLGSSGQHLRLTLTKMEWMRKMRV
jgi:hypothetical protein